MNRATFWLGTVALLMGLTLSAAPAQASGPRECDITGTCGGVEEPTTQPTPQSEARGGSHVQPLSATTTRRSATTPAPATTAPRGDVATTAATSTENVPEEPVAEANSTAGSAATPAPVASAQPAQVTTSEPASEPDQGSNHLWKVLVSLGLVGAGLALRL